MHPWPYQIVRRRPACDRASRVHRDPCLGAVRMICLIMTMQVLGMVMATPLRSARRSAILPGADGETSPWNSMRPRRAQTLPVHRSILAVDIEDSTRRKNPVKEELREQVYRLLLEALGAAGINEAHCDPFTDRGDGVLVLLRPADEIPKPLLLIRLIPALASLLVAHNDEISPHEHPRVLRLRVVLHAGEVHHDSKGPFGEDLDIAFRLLDAPRFKAHLRSATVPLALVASDYIYRSIIRHGYDGIDDDGFRPLVSVNVGDQRQKGWVHFPRPSQVPIAIPAQAGARAC
jgi:class 3 adenylate cyclase